MKVIKERSLSWRRFVVLLANLGPNSALAYSLSDGGENQNETLETQEETDNFLEGY